MISVDLLGPLVITIAGSPVGKLPKKSRALLAYLAMAGEPVGRDRLADLLWPYQASEQARHSLRNCVLEISRRLGPRLGRNQESLWFAAETDLQRLRELAGGGLDQLSAAAALIRGELLQDLNITTSDAWQDWLEHERALILRTITQVLRRYAEHAGAAGRHDEAIAAARQLVFFDNLNEEAHRLLMRTLAAAGRRGEAVGQFKTLEKLLRHELGVAPDKASRALAEELIGADATGARRAAERIVRHQPAPNDGLIHRLDKLVAEIRCWKSGDGRLTRPLIGECEASMAAAASEIRRLQARLLAVGALPKPVPEPVFA